MRPRCIAYTVRCHAVIVDCAPVRRRWCRRVAASVPPTPISTNVAAPEPIATYPTLEMSPPLASLLVCATL